MTLIDRIAATQPEAQYEMAEALFAGPYCEVFSRSSRPGWDSFGDEVGKFDDVELRYGDRDN